MAKRITYESKEKATLAGDLAEPSGAAKAPGLLVIQEWHGVNDGIRGLVDRFAAEGFLAFAPDLYHGKVTTSDDEASKLMTALDKPKAVAEIGDAAAFLASHARSTGKVAVTGFCLGGGLAFGAALSNPRLTAAVPFYGLPGLPAEVFSAVKVPILAHFAAHDGWAKPSAAEEIKAAIEKGGGSMELHVYDANHAFMRVGGQAYDEKSAKLAWDRTVSFLKKHLS